MPSTPTQTVRQQRTTSIRRVLLGLFLGLVSGYFTWSYLAGCLETKPLYRLKHFPAGQRSSISTVGPWLIINKPNEAADHWHREYRQISDGQLIHQSTGTGSEVIHYFCAADHPEPAHRSLLGRRIEHDKHSLVIIEPHTGVEREVSHWDRLVGIRLSYNGQFYCQIRQLPLTPLFALGVNGLPDALMTDFYSYLGNGDLTDTALRITLVQVYASADGQLLGSCSLPCKLGLYVDVHLIDDGEHLLLTSRPNAPSLSAYFQAKSASPEAQAQLARHSIPLMIMNFRTGQIPRQWLGQGWCSLDRQDESRFLHRSADVEPVLQWASSRPYRKPRFHVIDTREMSMLELVRPEYEYAELLNHDNDGYLLQTIQLIRDGSNQTSAPANAFTSYDKSGKQLSEKLLQMDGSTRAQLIRSQRQVIVYHSDDYPWAETWRNWKQRWPWLSIFPLEDRPRCWVWDIDSNQQLLVLTSRLSNLEASPDGQYLLVGKGDHIDNLTELSVYALPLPLVPWWKVWLPRIAAAASFAIIWLLVMKLKRPQRQPTADRVS